MQDFSFFSVPSSHHAYLPGLSDLSFAWTHYYNQKGILITLAHSSKQNEI